ncbi:MAG: YbaN family protein [Pseudomonadota bacterium]
MNAPGRWAFKLLTAGALGLAAAGAVLPLLPTTPFVLLAAWSASRHSPELEARLLSHPRVGPALGAWRRERALSRRAKVAAVSMLALSLGLTLLTVDAVALKALVGGTLVTVGLYLVTRPEPRSPQAAASTRGRATTGT